MLLKVTHHTDLSYSDLISESVMELRMAPRQEPDQHRLSFTLAVGPPTAASSYFDWLGNTVHWFTVNSFHKQIRIVATSVVETDRPRPEPQRFKDTWPVPADAYDYSVYDFLQFGGPIVDCPRCASWSLTLDPKPGDSLGELALADHAPDRRPLHLPQGDHHLRQPDHRPADQRLRRLPGLHPPDDRHGPRACASPPATSAAWSTPTPNASAASRRPTRWCELLFPSARQSPAPAGSASTPPTTASSAAISSRSPSAATTATSRPTRASTRGNAKESIDVAVHTEQLKEIPPELAAERVQSLPIPVYPQGPAFHREMINQQQEQ